MPKKLKRPVSAEIPEKWRDTIPAGDPPVRPGKLGYVLRVCTPALSAAEKKYVVEAVETGWISSGGPFLEKFEKRFAEYCGVKFAVSCSSGTTALHLAVQTAGVEPGDEVILPAFTMVATMASVVLSGAAPVLVDCDPKTWNLDVAQVEAAVTPKTRLIMPVHIYGLPADMDSIRRIGDKHGLWVIEDGAEAIGAEVNGRRVGSLGHAAAFSFYANKIVTTGEGGMVTTDDADFASTARTLKNHAFSADRPFWHRYVGFNYRMTNLQAAIGLGQMERVDQLVDARLQHARMYTDRLKNIRGIIVPPSPAGYKNVYWMYGILVEKEFGMTRDEVRRCLADLGVETRVFFVPMHLQPVYRDQYPNAQFPVAEKLCREGLYLPSSSSLTETEIDFVCECIEKIRKSK